MVVSVLKRKCGLICDAQGPQFGFGGQPFHFLLADALVEALLRQPQRVDAPRRGHRRRVEERAIIRQQAPPTHQVADTQHEAGRSLVGTAISAVSLASAPGGSPGSAHHTRRAFMACATVPAMQSSTPSTVSHACSAWVSSARNRP